jgi:hypothetical protein
MAGLRMDEGFLYVSRWCRISSLGPGGMRASLRALQQTHSTTDKVNSQTTSLDTLQCWVYLSTTHCVFASLPVGKAYSCPLCPAPRLYARW